MKKKMSSEEEEEEEEEQEQQQLEEGLYEIEEIRKKRVRKGQIQYLIKWRGWPESSNTWEPYDSLQSTCADVIEAFEQQQSRKSSRKRKRRTTGGSPTTTTSAAAKKKKPSETTDTAPPPPPPVDSDSIGVPVGGGEEKEGNNSNNDNAGDGTQTNTAENADPPPPPPPHPIEANGSPDASTKDKDAAGSISVQLNSGGGGGGDEVSLDEENPSKTEGTQALVLLGAKKRKSGRVKRFKHEPAAANQEEADSTEEDNGKRDPPRIITKILMPVDYCATVTDNVQHVSITFRALRSDGREVLVDNKDLKANNPELLFSYYEQHLRYTPRT